jgi:hypothetical protein
MSLGYRQYVNNPIVNGRTEAVRLASAGVGASALLWTAIVAAAADATDVTGILISANAGDIYLSTTVGVATTVGIKIVQNTNLYLPVQGSTCDLCYEGVTPDIMLFY